MSWKKNRISYQWVLIVLSLAAAILISIFVFREVFPEYLVYQNAYTNLEEYVAQKEGRKPPPFKSRIKQVVIKKDSGPEIIDRCVSCHVALDLPHFSPSRVIKDPEGRVLVDLDGKPLLEDNPDYIFAQIEQELNLLKDPSRREELEKKGLSDQIIADQVRVDQLESLITVSWKGEIIDLKKVLKMHPLIGKETQPFELHPIAEYGCVVCHNGNGRGLVTDRAHGPIFDGEYEAEKGGIHPVFLEKDKQNDPSFAKMFNHKPSHRLLFQTTPLYIGPLMEANCAQCHASSQIQSKNQSVIEQLNTFKSTSNALEENISQDKKSLEQLKQVLQTITSYEKTKDRVWLDKLSGEAKDEASKYGIEKYNQFISSRKEVLDNLINLKAERLELIKKDISLLENGSIQGLSNHNLASMKVPLESYQTGFKRFMSNGCYACHKIELISRGGVGPELTYEGNSYPWFVKESIVWPQADLQSSQMPNFHLDHIDIEALMTYVMSQKGKKETVSAVDYETQVRQWNEGALNEWEEAIPADQIFDLKTGKKVFATEGCASCHRIKGYKSVFQLSENDRDWFKNTFKEQSEGSDLIQLLIQHQDRIFASVKYQGDNDIQGLLEDDTDLLYSFYSPLRYVFRGRNHEFEERLKIAQSLEEKDVIKQELKKWQEAADLLLFLYIEEYGLGRLVAPRLDWSGIYRSDQWLMEHFIKPSGHVPNSIMPAFPFDESKFLSLTYFLNSVSKENRDAIRQRWLKEGFSPKEAYETHCALCHGEQRRGQGVSRAWIYPVPKNLKNGFFLQNLTKEKAIYSLTHGVKGTPMAPWGSLGDDKEGEPVLSQEQIKQLVDWIYESLPASEVLEEDAGVQKWEYMPTDIIEELQKEEGVPLSSMNQYHELSNITASVQLIDSGDFSNIKSVEDLFTIDKDSSDQKCFMIKSKYYTPDNIQAGQQLYQLHCAHCHGDQGGGNGLRAASMIDAKPRYLTNVDWLESRDDLRILRSLKYGVLGTSMSPMGAYTSMKQRIQLAVYVRSLAQEKVMKTIWESFVFETHKPSIYALDQAYSPLISKINQYEVQLQEVQSKLTYAINESLDVDISSLQQQQLDLAKKLSKVNKALNIYRGWKATLEERSQILNRIGIQYISLKPMPEQFNSLKEKIINLLPIVVFDKALTLSEEKNTLMSDIESFNDQIKDEVKELQTERSRLEADIFSLERDESLSIIKLEMDKRINFIRLLDTSLKQVEQLNNQQQHFFDSYQQEQDLLR